MANEVIKVFITQNNAYANSSTGSLGTVEAVASNKWGYSNSEGSTTSGDNFGPFYIYNKYFFRFEANDPVREFHIDWDEGEDNSSEKSSLEIIKLDNPSHSVVTSHIFTEHKVYYPLIRVKSVDGFLSKWYTSNDTTGFTTGRLLPLEDSAPPAGQNERSIVSVDKTVTTESRIPYFAPSNMPPVGVLKADKKRIYSSIDNDTILSTFAYPLFYTSSETAVASANKPDIKFTFQDSNGAILEETLDGTKILSSTIAQYDQWTIVGAASYLATSCVPSGNYSGSTRQSVHKIIIKDGATNTNMVWLSSAGNDKYIDIHYEAGLADNNGNYHCRIFFVAGAGDSEGIPGGASAPDGYSALKCGLGGSPGSHASIAEELRVCLNANAVGGLEISMIVGSVGSDGTDSYFSCTLNGEGAVTAWSESTDLNSPNRVDCAVTTAGITSANTLTTSARKLLRVELVNAKKLADTDKVFIMVFDATLVLSAVADIDINKTIAILSNGNPIIELGDAFSTVTLDGTESQTRASNVDIASHYLDNDKLNYPVLGNIQALNTTQQSDVLNTTLGNNISEGVNSFSYTFDRNGYVEDSHGIILPMTRLCRLQVVDNATFLTNTNHIDALNTSLIESFDGTTTTNNHYTAAVRKMPSSLEHRELLLFGKYSEVARTNLNWYNQAASNIDTRSSIMGGSSGDFTFVTSGGATGKHPLHHLLFVKTEKFDRIHFRLDNTTTDVASPTHNVEMTAYYTDGTTWKPLEIIDDTQGLKTSGSVKFNMPSDWVKDTADGIDGGDWDGPVEKDVTGNGSGGSAPDDYWDFDGYGILISFNIYGTSTNVEVANVWPYNNSHSQLIEIVDPHHVSLNDIPIAQSISFGRSTKLISVEDKFGKADIRKIGAAGGAVTFGGIDLGGSTDTRKTMVGYQKNATHVFLDVTHKSNEITRFFVLFLDYPKTTQPVLWFPNGQ